MRPEVGDCGCSGKVIGKEAPALRCRFGTTGALVPRDEGPVSVDPVAANKQEEARHGAQE
ncbi:hypothetical protein GCM10027174_13080 [Salinifilum aidingensis]